MGEGYNGWWWLKRKKKRKVNRKFITWNSIQFSSKYIFFSLVGLNLKFLDRRIVSHHPETSFASSFYLVTLSHSLIPFDPMVSELWVCASVCIWINTNFLNLKFSEAQKLKGRNRDGWVLDWDWFGFELKFKFLFLRFFTFSFWICSSIDNDSKWQRWR